MYLVRDIMVLVSCLILLILAICSLGKHAKQPSVKTLSILVHSQSYYNVD